MFFQKKMAPYPSRTYPIMQQPSLQPNEGQLAQMQRRFGMFLHFGVNTFNNTEWSDGTLPVESYCPSAIDADSWVRTAYEAGMNYVVLITKHHDAFACGIRTPPPIPSITPRIRPTSSGQWRMPAENMPPAGPLLFALGSARIMLRG